MFSESEVKRMFLDAMNKASEETKIENYEQYMPAEAFLRTNAAWDGIWKMFDAFNVLLREKQESKRVNERK